MLAGDVMTAAEVDVTGAQGGAQLPGTFAVAARQQLLLLQLLLAVACCCFCCCLLLLLLGAAAEANVSALNKANTLLL